MNTTQHQDRLTQAKWDLMQNFTARVFRKYENNNQVLASFGQTASTTKLVQVNWEKLKHLRSCLFVLCCQIQIDFQYLTENTFQG